jgi:hypothetical protein
MPACFNLTRKSDMKSGPVVLQTIDEEMCHHFMVPVHPTKWYQNWYNEIGMMIAIGTSFDELLEKSNDSEYWREMFPIVEWLNENFTASAWHEQKY